MVIEEERILLVSLCVIRLGESAALCSWDFVLIVEVVSEIDLDLNHGSDVYSEVPQHSGCTILTGKDLSHGVYLCNFHLEAPPRWEVGRVDIVGPIHIGQKGACEEVVVSGAYRY